MKSNTIAVLFFLLCFIGCSVSKIKDHTCVLNKDTNTIKAPFFPGYDGYHPVSGNRKFGYHIDSDGNMIIYTRGTDRFFFPSTYQGPEILLANLIETIAFAGADNLWSSFQNKLKNYALANGGSATITTPIKNRPKVYDELKNLLKSSNQLNYIPCGN